MKRSRAVNLVLLASAIATLEACNRRQCVDENNTVVDERYCLGQLPPGPHGYRWFYSSYSSSATAVGSHVDPSSATVRGVFGSAGDAAGSGHGSGAGE